MIAWEAMMNGTPSLSGMAFLFGTRINM